MCVNREGTDDYSAQMPIDKLPSCIHPKETSRNFRGTLIQKINQIPLYNYSPHGHFLRTKNKEGLETKKCMCRTLRSSAGDSSHFTLMRVWSEWNEGTKIRVSSSNNRINFSFKSILFLPSRHRHTYLRASTQLRLEINF